LGPLNTRVNVSVSVVKHTLFELSHHMNYHLIDASVWVSQLQTQSLLPKYGVTTPWAIDRY
jgi:hypothetical protein